jgi:CIC family chloride channel protein
VTTRFAGRIVSFIRSAFLPRRWAEQAPWSDQQVGLLLWAGVVGAAGAILASGLRWAGDAFQDLLWGSGGGITSQVAAAPQWMRLVLPAAGGIVAGAILVYGLKMARTERGWGILEAVVLRDGVLKFRR